MAIERVTQGVKNQASVKAHEMLGNINRIIMLQEMQQGVIGKGARDDLMKARDLVTRAVNHIEQME